MKKIAIATFALIFGLWIQIGMQPEVNLNRPFEATVCALTLGWVVVFGSYIAWLLILIMVRQLGSAIRGN